MSRKDKKTYPLCFLIPAMAIYFVFFIFPSLSGMFYAFTDWNSRSIHTYHFVWLDNFKSIFSNGDLKLALFNTFFFAVVTVVLKNVVGLGLALLANNKAMLSKSYMRGVFYMPNFLNMVIIGVMFTAILYPTGPLNAMLKVFGIQGMDWLNDRRIAMFSVCLVEVWRTAGFHMIIYLSALKSIPSEYFEAARVDGAGYFACLRHIILPLILQGITINLIFAIINGLKVFDQVYILTNGGPGNATQVVSTTIYKMFGNGLWGMGTAYNLVLTVFILLVCGGVLAFMGRKEVDYN